MGAPLAPGPLAAPVTGLAQAADFTLTAPPLAAVAGEACHDITATTQSPRSSLPARSAPIRSQGVLGRGQQLAGGYCLIQLTVCVRVRIWEGER